jgi:hypothetical protein
MNNFSLIVLTLLFLNGNLTSQNKITFSVDATPMIKKEIFLPQKGDSLVIRGNFNSWSGNKQALNDPDGDSIYSLTYNIGGSAGDTFQYKFVIVKSEGFDSWEVNPDPNNPDHGNRTLVLTGQHQILPAIIFDADNYIKYPVTFSKAELQEDYCQMKEALETYHPALYEFTSKEKFDILSEDQYKLINDGLSIEEYHKILEPPIAAVGCGHTGIWLPNNYWYVAPNKYFPLKLKFIGNKVFSAGQYKDSLPIPVGSEIHSINKRLINEIVDTLIANHRADGFNHAFKSARVEKKFSKLFALQFGFPDKFEVQFIPPGTNQIKKEVLKPVNVNVINLYQLRGSLLEIDLREDISTAVLTINTFIYYDQLEMFKSFIDSAFNEIQGKNIKNLVIDLRGNDGGDPFCSTYLLSYIEKEPVRYFSEPHGNYKPLSDPIPIADSHFEGNVYTLIDGNGFSTIGHLCAVLKYNNICTFVGTELGSTYVCNGATKNITLKNTRMILWTAHRHSYSAAVDGMDKRRGIIPDYTVEPTVEDLIEGRDTVKEFTLKLIETNLE